MLATSSKSMINPGLLSYMSSQDVAFNIYQALPRPLRPGIHHAHHRMPPSLVPQLTDAGVDRALAGGSLRTSTRPKSERDVRRERKLIHVDVDRPFNVGRVLVRNNLPTWSSCGHPSTSASYRFDTTHSQGPKRCCSLSC